MLMGENSLGVESIISRAGRMNNVRDRPTDTYYRAEPYAERWKGSREAGPAEGIMAIPLF